MSAIVIVDYGSGNVRSMQNALAHVAGPDAVRLTRNPDEIANAARLVVPGVGAFGACMQKLHDSGVVGPLKAAVARGAPVLGVCVGMQVLADVGEEFGTHAGLGFIPGVVRRLAPLGEQKLPHMGFAPLTTTARWPFAEAPGSLYFVHSYAFLPRDPQDSAASADYGGPFVAAVRRANVLGVQFHPEKSATAGLRFLRAFCAWQPAAAETRSASQPFRNHGE